MRKPNPLIVSFIHSKYFFKFLTSLPPRRLWSKSLGTVSGYKQSFLADTPQKVDNIQRAKYFAYS